MVTDAKVLQNGGHIDHGSFTDPQRSVGPDQISVTTANTEAERWQTEAVGSSLLLWNRVCSS
jgi:hypothetical protein